MALAAAQVEDPLKSPTLENLLTADQSILLNTVDRLRSYGVSKYIQLPQIIVCGDQSSGKSSVLEAISHISFPRGEGICTTFPTELALRRGSNRTVKIQLKPSTARPEPERVLLASYQPPVGDLKDFERLVNDAKAHLKRAAGTNRGADSFFEDTLHIEVTDPNWPPLSLVDLPGLISAPNPEQKQEDVTIVNNLVSSYMRNPKSIILAVISASYELPIQKVFSMINKYDPSGKRTICVVTKPDNACPGPEELPQFVRYAQNKLPGYNFELGWHVVMNGGHNSRTPTLDDRDKAEKDFFTLASWNGILHRDQLGISKLRARLSTLLEHHTRAEMPKVLKQIREKLEESRDELSKLGLPRSTSHDQKVYLTTISQRFEGLVRQATNGHYDDPSFFLPGLPESDPRKLRAALQNLNEGFAQRMHERGHAKHIVNAKVIGAIDYWPNSTPVVSSNTSSPLPEVVQYSEYIQHIKSLSRRNRGTELIGSPNFGLVRDLFIDQSRPWRGLAIEHLENVWQVVVAHLSTVSDNVASQESAAAIRREIIFGAMDVRHKLVMEKLEELLKPYEKSHPITYDRCYIAKSRDLHKADVTARLTKYQRLNVRNLQSDTKDGSPQPPPGLQIDQILSALKLDLEDIDEIDCTDILNSTQAYYEGALRTFIDNIAVLAVEGCLIDDLEDIFSPTAVIKMDDEKLRALGGESELAQVERSELEQKVAVLQDAQRECLRAGAVQEHQSQEPTLSKEVREETTVQASLSLETPSWPHLSPHRNSSAATKTSKTPSSTSKTAASTPARELFTVNPAPSTLTASAFEAPINPFAPSTSAGFTASSNAFRTSPFGSSTKPVFGGPPSTASSLSPTPTQTTLGFRSSALAPTTGLFGKASSTNLFSTADSAGSSANKPGNNPLSKTFDNIRITSNLQNEPHVLGELNRFQVLPIYMGEIMSFEELRLVEEDAVEESGRLYLLQRKINESQPAGKEFTIAHCSKLLTME
ncbi:P-loop containing nucleoside triphosphate hydrolase protein [Bisporella sp. PMI_857]|nr:P-loop containing nucleoside triphosphate hydrolase protein [Bisporella sp. PMI_857]